WRCAIFRMRCAPVLTPGRSNQLPGRSPSEGHRLRRSKTHLTPCGSSIAPPGQPITTISDMPQDARLWIMLYRLKGAMLARLPLLGHENRVLWRCVPTNPNRRREMALQSDPDKLPRLNWRERPFGAAIGRLLGIGGDTGNATGTQGGI